VASKKFRGQEIPEDQSKATEERLKQEDIEQTF
jgi:hypothetical protein